MRRHPKLVPKTQKESAYIEPDDGSIADGDDNLWSGDRKYLSGGRWKDLGLSCALGKRQRDGNEDDIASHSLKHQRRLSTDDTFTDLPSSDDPTITSPLNLCLTAMKLKMKWR